MNYRETTHAGRSIRVHILVAEKALGKPLPPGVEVHHVNGNIHDNRPENLVICPSKGYHRMLHIREKALNACGHANWKPCRVCKQYDAPENLAHYQQRKRNGYVHFVQVHRECNAKFQREYRAKRKEAASGQAQ